PAALDRIRESDGHVLVTVEGGHLERLPLDEQEEGVRRLAEAGGVLDEGIEYGLEIRRGARDDPEDLAGRRLLRQRLAEIVVASLELVEQARILDGDDG